VLVADNYRRSVCFLFVDRTDEATGTTRRTPAATAFLVGVPIDESAAIPYAVTARHVIDSARPFGPIHVRLNTRVGSFDDVATDPVSWASHPTSDVAVVRLQWNSDWDQETVLAKKLATQEYVAQKHISEGDEVFFVGLFSEHPGHERNQPVVRFGSIALMPREKLPLRLDPGSGHKTPVGAYLIEARSWGGHSGSPAFVFYLPTREEGFIELTTFGQSQVMLLGLVHGHYDIPTEVEFVGDILGEGHVSVNAGMAAVIPAQDIIDTLMQAELVDERRRLAAKRHADQ
jgi:hypothetical protein